MSKLSDLTAQKFGRWTVLHRVDSRYSQARWLCVCDCGRVGIRYGGALRSGRSRSCGCVSIESRNRSGSCFGPTYKAWRGMLQRCLNPNNPFYQKHEGNIQVCDRWNPARGGSFANFLEDMGRKPDGFSLFRIDDTQDFDAENCRWMTKTEHHALQRRRMWVDRGYGYNRPAAEIPARIRN
jgi:hypothetical protein